MASSCSPFLSTPGRPSWEATGKIESQMKRFHLLSSGVVIGRSINPATVERVVMLLEMGKLYGFYCIPSTMEVRERENFGQPPIQHCPTKAK